MHHPTDRIIHTTACVTPVVEHWLEREITQWVHPMKDRSDEPSHHERTLLPQSYISLMFLYEAILMAHCCGSSLDCPCISWALTPLHCAVSCTCILKEHHHVYLNVSINISIPGIVLNCSILCLRKSIKEHQCTRNHTWTVGTFVYLNMSIKEHQCTWYGWTVESLVY